MSTTMAVCWAILAVAAIATAVDIYFNRRSMRELHKQMQASAARIKHMLADLD